MGSDAWRSRVDGGELTGHGWREVRDSTWSYGIVSAFVANKPDQLWSEIGAERLFAIIEDDEAYGPFWFGALRAIALKGNREDVRRAFERVRTVSGYYDFLDSLFILLECYEKQAKESVGNALVRLAEWRGTREACEVLAYLENTDLHVPALARALSHGKPDLQLLSTLMIARCAQEGAFSAAQRDLLRRVIDSVDKPTPNGTHLTIALSVASEALAGK